MKVVYLKEIYILYLVQIFCTTESFEKKDKDAPYRISFKSIN